jgi:hypothetical protein
VRRDRGGASVCRARERPGPGTTWSDPLRGHVGRWPRAPAVVSRTLGDGGKGTVMAMGFRGTGRGERRRRTPRHGRFTPKRERSLTRFVDVFTGETMLSDAFPIRPVAGGYVYEVSPASRDNFIVTFDLREICIDSLDWFAHVEIYLRRLERRIAGKAPRRLAEFDACVSSWIREVLDHFDDTVVFTAASGDIEHGMMIVAMPTEDDNALFHYFRDGLTAVVG